ncbi:uncharacterized protein LOC106093262 [Stomoxys calcitrans]|uniref:uncharacterized protein LOC106093262 n=1 Tax=Stomoxys calcitrans TaxID=35570 RepID=UPI0027E2D001|nr:uncharacterized protein LOC106093262 [Stomoxys calcitrans]
MAKFIIDKEFFGNEAKIIKFTKLECKDYDKSFIQFKQCQLKAVGRNRIALQLHGDLKKNIDEELTINAELFRKSHDFRPFMYNDTMEFCSFVRNPNRYMFWKILVQDMIQFTNINHTCPYENEIIIKDLILEENMFKTLPFPGNDYMVHVKAILQNEIKAELKVYVVLIE